MNLNILSCLLLCAMLNCVISSPLELGSANRLNSLEIMKRVKVFIKKMNSPRNSKKFCPLIKNIDRRTMQVYISKSSTEDLSVVVPRAQLSNEKYEAVVVVDPFPNHSFGHPLLTFYVKKLSRKSCRRHGGKSFQKKTFCLIPSIPSSETGCETNMLPLVYSATEFEITNQTRQTLRCYSVQNFKPCPNKIYPVSVKNCENSYDEARCNQAESENQRLTNCNGTKCDYGMLLFGGWDKVTPEEQHELNLLKMHNMLTRNSFSDENIKVFYQGNVTINVPFFNYLPPVNKVSVRSHIRRICSSSCVDSFVIYMNGHSNTDGSTLFTDANENGQVDENERYSPDELLDDIEDCSADHLFIMIDQSRATEIKRKFDLRSYPSSYSLVVPSEDFSPTRGSRSSTYQWSKLTPTSPFSSAYTATAETSNGDHANRFTIFGGSSEMTEEQLANQMGCFNQSQQS